MKINFKVRFKNPIFIAQLVLSILTPILAYMGMDATAITSWAILGDVLFQAISNPYVLAMVALSVWNCVNDPTTSGVSDSERALSYDKPATDEDLTV